MGVVLRLATREDAEFAFRSERETMQAYAVATWGSWREAESRQRAVENVLGGRTQVIELDGVPVGILRVERSETCIDVKQIFILNDYQRRGVGSELMHRLIREAEAAKVPLKLRVLKVNPAQDFYKRLGFSVTSSSREHVYMQYAL